MEYFLQRRNTNNGRCLDNIFLTRQTMPSLPLTLNDKTRQRPTTLCQQIAEPLAQGTGRMAPMGKRTLVGRLHKKEEEDIITIIIIRR